MGISSDQCQYHIRRAVLDSNGIEDGDNSVNIGIRRSSNLNGMGNVKNDYVHVHEISSRTVVDFVD